MSLNIVIGYDTSNRMPAYTAAESIMQNTTSIISFTFLHKDMLASKFTRKRTIKESTDFSISRFLVPYLFDYSGVVLYVDNDIIVKSDVAELFNFYDDSYSVMCVKHSQETNSNKKFLNNIQHSYNFKNWSSVMLFNNSKCTALTPQYVNTAPGLDLHQFRWLDNLEQIGSLPLEWNYLVENKNQTTNPPKLIHYTNGGPYFKEYLNCDYSQDWINVYNTINDVRSFS